MSKKAAPLRHAQRSEVSPRDYLIRANLWPVLHTRDFYRRAAHKAPEALVRAILLLAADRLPR